jgi:hypothetical protein
VGNDFFAMATNWTLAPSSMLKPYWDGRSGMFIRILNHLFKALQLYRCPDSKNIVFKPAKRRQSHAFCFQIEGLF